MRLLASRYFLALARSELEAGRVPNGALVKRKFRLHAGYRYRPVKLRTPVSVSMAPEELLTSEHTSDSLSVTCHLSPRPRSDHLLTIKFFRWGIVHISTLSQGSWSWSQK